MLHKVEAMLLDFYDIPGYSNYSINMKGEVFSKLSNGLLNGSFNPAGYLNFRIKHDLGFTFTWGRHRLLMYVFRNPKCDINNLVVNHLNGIKGDDWLDNLEWTTYKKNQEHAGAMGLTDKCIQVSVNKLSTGEILKFPSIIECAKYMGLSKDAVVHRLKIGEKRIFPELAQYRKGHSDEDWFMPSDLDLALLDNGTSKRILVRNVVKKTVRIFDRITDACNHLRVPVSTMSAWLRKPNQPTLPGFIQVKFANDTSPWRDVSNPLLEVAEFHNKKHVVVNFPNGDSKTFTSLKDCSIELKMKISTVHFRLNNPKSKSNDGLVFNYLCS